LSGYLWLVPCKAATASETIEVLMRWFATFGVVLYWFSDQGSHFKNEVIQGLQRKLKAKHHFSTANCPWANGTIESACKQVIRNFRALLSDFKMAFDDWQKVLPLVQSALNNSPSSRKL
jgi:transposase InsO family protein